MNCAEKLLEPTIFFKPECDHVLQPEPRSGEGCYILSHEGLAKVNIRKIMLYRHCYVKPQV